MRLALSLALLAGLLLLVWNLQQEPDPPSSLDLDAPPSEAVEATEAELLEGSQDASDDPEGRVAAAPVAEPEGLVPQVSSEQFEEPGITVRVLGADGEPQPGVSVELERTVKGFDRSNGVAHAVTDGSGVAFLELKDETERRARMEQMGIEMAHRITADVPTTQVITKPLDGWPQDGDAHELRLPPLASVTVEVLDHQGELYTGEASVGLWWVAQAEAEADPNCAYERCWNHFRDTEGGRARFDAVGPGLALQLVAHAEGLESASVRGLQGPTRSGEEWTTQLQLGQQRPRLKFRVTQPGGEPCASRTLHAYTWTGGNRRPSHSWFDTDEEGVVILDGWSSGTFESERRLQVFVNASEADLPLHHASVMLPRTLRPGVEVDLGELRLQSPRTLLQGHVVAADGTPLSGARLLFREGHENAGRMDWQNLRDGVVSSGRNGEFELLSILEPKALGVYVTLHGHGTLDQRDLPIGQRGVELRMGPPPEPKEKNVGKLALAGLLDEGLPGHLFELVLLDARGRERGLSDSAQLWALNDKGYELPSVKPGRWTAVVRTYGLEAELLRVEDVEVRAGEVCRDARLTPFDLRGRARMVRFQVTWPDGTAVRDRRLQVGVAGTRLSDQMSTSDDGWLEFVLPTSVNQVTVTEDWKQYVTVNVGTDQKVALPPR